MAYLEPVDEAGIIALRREIHAWPEPGWAEFVSTARVIRHLEEAGLTVLCGREVINPDFIRGANRRQIEEGLAAAREKGVDDAMLVRMDGITGVVGILDTGRPGPTIAMRFELDCVPVTETKDPAHRPNAGGYASCRPGYMHACGHDGHQAVGMMMAKWLAANKDNLTGRVKLCFQPAEEGVRGARPMAESGVLDDVDFLYVMHVGCDIPGGEVVTAPEKFLCTTKVDFRFQGTASHAGMQPEVGRNALTAAATAALALMGLPRHGEGMTRVNVGYLRAGEGRNVIASTAEMQVEVRGENEKINTTMFEEACRRCEGAAAMYGCTVSHEVMGEAVDFVPDAEAQALAAEAAAAAPYVEKVSPTMNFNGSDDATILIKRVQATAARARTSWSGRSSTPGTIRPPSTSKKSASSRFSPSTATWPCATSELCNETSGTPHPGQQGSEGLRRQPRRRVVGGGPDAPHGRRAGRGAHRAPFLLHRRKGGQEPREVRPHPR